MSHWPGGAQVESRGTVAFVLRAVRWEMQILMEEHVHRRTISSKSDDHVKRGCKLRRGCIPIELLVGDA